MWKYKELLIIKMFLKDNNKLEASSVFRLDPKISFHTTGIKTALHIARVGRQSHQTEWVSVTNMHKDT
jgi:hypothetical protein